MKKSLLALAVAAVASASVAQAATVYDKDGTSLAVYGRVQAVVYSGDTGNTDAQGDYGDNSLDASARLGLDMRTQLASWVDGFAKAEWEAANGDDGEGGDDDFNGRYLWVGLDFGQFGSIKFGKFEDAIKYAIAPTDIFEDFGCVAQLGNDDRRSGQAMYEWSGWGVDFKLSGQTAANGQQVDGAYYGGEKGHDIDSGFAVSAGYTSPDVLFGPISIKAGYSYVKFQQEGELADGESATAAVGSYDDYNQWAVSLSWGGDTGLYTAVMYQCRDFDMYDDIALNVGTSTSPVFYGINDYKVQGVEFVVRYGFQNGMSVIAGYQWQNFDMDGSQPDEANYAAAGVANPDLDASVVNLEFDYQITPNFKVWTEARWDVDTDEGYDWVTAGVTNYEEDVYSIGARYTF